MAEATRALGPDNGRLITFSLGTFHAVMFLVAAVLVLHLANALVGVLTSLNTLTGLVLFAALWATTTWSTGRVLRDVGDVRVSFSAPIGAVVVRAVWAGARNGVLFLACAAVILALSALATGQGDSIIGFVLGGLFFVPVGLLAAAMIGAILGLVFAAIDLFQVWVAGRLLSA
jgi:hypothetical protein